MESENDLCWLIKIKECQLNSQFKYPILKAVKVINIYKRFVKRNYFFKVCKYLNMSLIKVYTCYLNHHIQVLYWMVHSKASGVLHSVFDINDNTPSSSDQRKPATNQRARSWMPPFKIMLWSGKVPLRLRGPQGWPDSRLFEYCIICKWAWILSSHHHYLISLSRKLYFPKSLSFGAIRWSFLALASFSKRNSLRSIHSFSSCSPCASLHKSSSVHVPLRNLSQTLKVPVGNRYCQQFWSSSELKTLSLCFSEVICCCHCFSLLQFLPHSQQWLPATSSA